MEVQGIHSQQTMSSREMADLSEKRHDSVKRTIGTLVGKGVIGVPQIVGYQDSLGRPASEFHIGKRDSYVVMAQLSPEFTARLVDRWQELESKQQAQSAHAIPKTMAQALRLAADQAEQIEAQQLLIEQQKPAVEFVDRFVEAKSSKGFREVAKILGVKEREFIAGLASAGVIFKQGNNWLPKADYQPRYFTVKAGEANGHAFHQTRFTPEGIAWVAKRHSKAA